MYPVVGTSEKVVTGHKVQNKWSWYFGHEIKVVKCGTVSLFIVTAVGCCFLRLMKSTKLTAVMHDRLAVGSEKQCLSDKIRK